MAGGHITEAPATLMYASIVLTKTVRVALIIVALNDLEIKWGNIFNVFAQASVTEKVWTTLGPEFGKEARKTAVIIRDLYGLKSAGGAFRSHLVKCMESLGYKYPSHQSQDLANQTCTQVQNWARQGYIMEYEHGQ